MKRVPSFCKREGFPKGLRVRCPLRRRVLLPSAVGSALLRRRALLPIALARRSRWEAALGAASALRECRNVAALALSFVLNRLPRRACAASGLR